MRQAKKTISKLLHAAGFSPYWMFKGMPEAAKKLTILMYHSIHPEPAPFSITPAAFQRQIAFIKDNYTVCRLADVDVFLSNKHDRERRVAVTFDDAYENFLEFALPTLERLSVPCTMCVPTGFIGGWNAWELPKDELPRRKLLSLEQLRSLAALPSVEFGSHTVDHSSMRKLSQCEVEKQAVESKRQLEQLTGRLVETFSYPYGTLQDFSKDTTRVLMAAGYKRAVTSRWGTLNSYRDRMILRRIWLEEDDQSRDLHAKIRGDYDWMAAKERMGSAVRTIVRSAERRERERMD